jgi:sialic acid synthase SpsE
MSDIYIISELCGQWGGSTRRAEQMILQSKIGGADAVKVQLWDTYRLPGDNRGLWEYLSMSKEQFLHLKEYSESLNLDFFASAFHEDRFEWILEAGIGINKIASLLVDVDFDLCKKMIKTGMKTYCSLGKWNKSHFPFENENVEYMHCLSKYPHMFHEAIVEMPKEFKYPLTGYSDHSIGIDACKFAVSKGATVIEKHFTISHKLQSKTEGAHSCSMIMEELSDLRNFCEKQIT